MRSAAFALACLLASPTVDAHATDDVTVADAIAYRFAWARSPRTLHDETFRFPDGVKGRRVSIIIDRVLMGPPRAGLTDDDYLAWVGYCSSSAIVRATSVASVGVLTSAKDAIFTRTTYHVDDVIKGSGALAAGADVTTMRPGGEAEDAGERLRVVVDAMGTPIVGHHYLLELRSLERDGFADRFLSRASVADDLDAPLRVDFGFGRGSYAELKRSLQQASSIAPCPALRT